MKYIKKFENNIKTLDIENIVPREKVYAVFEKYSLSCDPKQNKSLNEVEYDDYEKLIKCSFTTYAYDGRVPNNILDILQNISYEIGADDFTFERYSKFGSYLVTFEYSYEKLKELEIKKDSEKYNL